MQSHGPSVLTLGQRNHGAPFVLAEHLSASRRPSVPCRHHFYPFVVAGGVSGMEFSDTMGDDCQAGGTRRLASTLPTAISVTRAMTPQNHGSL